jgi:hypothetical protein
MKHAPLALFVFNRPLHTARTITALQANLQANETEVYVFCDGPRRQEDVANVEQVRALVRNITGFKTVTVIERTENFGLARSIIEGVTALCNQYGRAIVLEDDLLTSRYFLQYMNDGLNLYANEHAVASVHGYMYPVNQPLPETFFLRGADCWGWATWKRAWDHFESDGAALLGRLEAGRLTRQFDYDGNSSFTRMLRNQIKGKNNSWAIRWHASAFLQNMLTLYPSRTLVENLGFDASGTHCSDVDYYATTIGDLPVHVHRISVEENTEARSAVVEFFNGVKRQRWSTLGRRLGSKLSQRLKSLGQRWRLS